MVANLLDFYRIPWEYEPRSFPLQWDKDGRVTEAFTPDFYLPEFDLYLEVTTMRQTRVKEISREVTPPPGIERVLFTEEQVNQRIREVAAEISTKYQGRDLKLI